MALSATVLHKLNSKTVKKIGFYFILFLIWQGIFFLTVDFFKIWKFYMFPSPTGVIESLTAMMRDGTLAIAVFTSLKRITAGYFIALIAVGIVGLILTKIKSAEIGVNGLILGFQTLPSICWLPFAILWFGLSEAAIIFIIVIGSIFSIAISVESGINNINPVYIRAGKNMGAKGFSLFRYIILPAAMPAVISGMKQGWSFAWRGVIAGEMLSASIGLGQILMMGRELADINQVAAVMLIIILIGVFIEKNIFGKVEQKIKKVRGVQ